MQTKPLETQLDELLNESVAAAQSRARTRFDVETAPFGKKFVLFGAGDEGRRVLARLRQDQIQPLAFSDNSRSKWGQTLDGLEVLSPDGAARRFGNEAAFIVTIYNHEHSFPQTRAQLTALGCAKVVSLVPLRWKYHETFLPFYRDDLPHKMLDQAEDIRRTLHFWTDEASRKEFVAQVRWRLLGDFDQLGPVCTHEQYFPQQEIFRLQPGESFVDAGAFDGDTIRHFLSLAGNNFRQIIALEPDPSNFQKLSSYISSLPDKVRNKIVARRLATGREPGRVRFAAGEGLGSSISDRGSIEVERMKLDDLLAATKPTYIKMDIEGAELDTLHGGRDVIAKDKPIVAACVYHAQDHLWKIPLALHDINPDYRLFLRPYRTECWDTVCYAVPEVRLLH